MNKKFILFNLIVCTLCAYSQTDSLILQPNALNGKDAWIGSHGPNNNLATNSDALIAAWTNGGNPSNKRFYIEFDLSTIPTGTTLDSAFLILYHNPNTSAHGGNHTGAGNSFYVRRVTSSWTETGITWNNQPSETSTNQVTVPSTSSGTQNFKIDVSTLTQDMLTNGNNGFSLRLTSETTYKAIVCASSDHPTSSLRPMLKVYYPGCQLPEVGYDFQISNNTVTFLDTSQSSSPYAWYWDFGDGTFSTQHNPTKTYTNQGVYNTCLVLTDSCGTDTFCQQLVLCNAPIANPQYQVNGQTVQFTGLPNNGISYFWDFGDGNFSTSQNPQYTYSFPSIYTACLTITDSCGIDTSCTVVGVPNIGIEEWETAKMKVYPNPNSGQFNIEFNQTLEGDLEIYSLSGQRVYSRKVNGQHNLELNLDLAKGMYLLRLTSQKQNLTQRLTIQ